MSKITTIVDSIISKVNNCAKLNGDQSIDGIKTFSSSPIVPTPINGNEAVNKDYIDSFTGGSVELTGTATFNGTNQNISMTNIGNSSLGIGDVIEVTGTTSNNKLFTIESITDNNNIVVNYEHRGTSTPVPMGRLINETASNCTIKLYNRAKNAPIGQGQYWCKPASRSKGVTYTNTTGKPIMVDISAYVGSSNGIYFIINGGDLRTVASQSGAAGVGAGRALIVPNGNTYSTSGGGEVIAWLELR